jgi:SH3 domain protein
MERALTNAGVRGKWMRKTWAVFLLCALIVLSMEYGLYAKGLYVRDRVNLPLKKSPSENSQVMGMANSNDYLDVKEESGDWVKVTTPDGQEGWVATRLLTSETPKALIVEQLNEKVKSLANTIDALQERNKILEKENRELKYSVSNLNTAIGKSKGEYDNLKQASSTYLELKEFHEKLVSADQAKTKQMEALTKENSSLKTSERLKFTLVGGGFIIIGMILGIMLQSVRLKPKRSGYKL